VSRIGVPRTVVLWAAIAIVCLPAAAAVAYQYIRDSQNRVVHLHTGSYDVLNNIDDTTGMPVRANAAINDWRDKLANRNTVAMNHAAGAAGAEVKLRDYNLPDSGADVVWSETWHQTALPIDVVFDRSQLTSWSGDKKQHKACKVLGNILGLDNAYDSNDCMEAGTSHPTIAAAGADVVDEFYGPNLSYGGPLHSWRADLKTTGIYDFEATADGHAIQSVTVKLDGTQIATKGITPCTGKCSVSVSPTVGGLTQGAHTVVVTARNEFGQAHSNSFPLTVRLPTPAWGFNEQWDTAANRDRIAETGDRPGGMGATTNRLHVNWADVEPNPPLAGIHTYNWGKYDAAYDEMIAAGQRPVLVVQDSPSWAWASGQQTCSPVRSCQYPPGSGHYTDWRVFVNRAILRFPQVLAIEVWNEPNFDTFWYPNPNAAAYVQLLRRARLAADDAGTTRPIITGGLSPGTQAVDQGQFLAGIYNAEAIYGGGPSPDFDGIGEHVYVRGAATTQDWIDRQAIMIDELREVRNARGDQSSGMWLTEVGVSTSPNSPGAVDSNAVALGAQGPTLAAMYRNVGNDVRVFLVHRYGDTVDDGVSSWLGHMGVRRLDRTAKPGFGSLRCELGGRYCQN
jgi:hypothetical protein